jgi:acyl carrier protein
MIDPTNRRNEIVTVVSRVLGLPEEDVARGVSPDSVERWDSERHVELVVALEDHFGCMFEAEDIPELTSIERMEEILARHGA